MNLEPFGSRRAAPHGRDATHLIVALLAGAALLASTTHQAHAQELTAKPIRLLVGLAAGGATDVMARLMAQKVSESLRTTVFVENKVGGNFIPALRELTGSQIGRASCRERV